MTDTSTADELPPQTNGISDNGIIDEEERARMRPADIDADVREMERRKRVELIMNSKLFREELERIIETQLKDGSGTTGLLQQISDMVGVNKQAGSAFKSSSCVIPINDIRGIESMGYAKGEKILRCKLAAVFRLIDLYGWTQSANTLITARLNQESEQFLVNPYGMLFHEMTASSLIKVGMQGNVLEQGTTNFSVNVTAFSLHAAVHAARPDLRCIIHVHTPSVVAISALKHGLLPLSQESVVIGEVSTHSYLGGLLDADEKDKLARNLGPLNKVLLLSNQGALCCGETIEEAFYNARNTILASESQLKILPLGVDNLVLLNDEARKKIYDAAHKAPESTPRPDQPSILEGKVERKWRVGGIEFEALMRMMDNAGFRTGYIYRHPLIKGEPPKPRNDVEVPPAVSSLGYLLEEEELYRQGLWKKLDGRKGNDRSRWLNSPNVYQKVEILETGTPDPKKITKWVADGSPSHSSTPVKIDDVLQFVPKGTNPREFKQKQQQIKDYRRADKISAGPQSHILEGVTWEEARKMQDAAVTQTGDQVVLMGAASKGIIQRGHQHNAMVYKSPYAKNPFDCVTDEELEDYKKVIEKKQKGDYDTDYSESDGFSSAQINKRLDGLHIRSPTSVTSETEEESRDEPRILRIETTTAPKPSQPEVVLSDDSRSPVEQFLRNERATSIKSYKRSDMLTSKFRTNSHAGFPKGSFIVPNPVHFHITRMRSQVQLMRPTLIQANHPQHHENTGVSLHINNAHSVDLNISLHNLRAFIYPFARALGYVGNNNQMTQTAYNLNHTPLYVDSQMNTLYSVDDEDSYEKRVLDSLKKNIHEERAEFDDEYGEDLADLPAVISWSSSSSSSARTYNVETVTDMRNCLESHENISTKIMSENITHKGLEQPNIGQFTVSPDSLGSVDGAQSNRMCQEEEGNQPDFTQTKLTFVDEELNNSLDKFDKNHQSIELPMDASLLGPENAAGKNMKETTEIDIIEDTFTESTDNRVESQEMAANSTESSSNARTYVLEKSTLFEIPNEVYQQKKDTKIIETNLADPTQSASDSSSAKTYKIEDHNIPHKDLEEYEMQAVLGELEHQQPLLNVVEQIVEPVEENLQTLTREKEQTKEIGTSLESTSSAKTYILERHTEQALEESPMKVLDCETKKYDLPRNTIPEEDVGEEIDGSQAILTMQQPPLVETFEIDCTPSTSNGTNEVSPDEQKSSEISSSIFDSTSSANKDLPKPLELVASDHEEVVENKHYTSFVTDFNGSAIETDIRVLRLAKVITDYLIEEGLEVDDVLVYPEFSDGGRLEKLIQKLTELYSELYPQDLNAEDKDNLRMSISLCILHHLSENDEEDEFGKVFVITEYLSEILDSLFSALDEYKILSNTHSTPDKPDAETYITSFKNYEGDRALVPENTTDQTIKETTELDIIEGTECTDNRVESQEIAANSTESNSNARTYILDTSTLFETPTEDYQEGKNTEKIEINLTEPTRRASDRSTAETYKTEVLKGPNKDLEEYEMQTELENQEPLADVGEQIDEPVEENLQTLPQEKEQTKEIGTSLESTPNAKTSILERHTEQPLEGLPRKVVDFENEKCDFTRNTMPDEDVKEVVGEEIDGSQTIFTMHQPPHVKTFEIDCTPSTTKGTNEVSPDEQKSSEISSSILDSTSSAKKDLPKEVELVQSDNEEVGENKHYTSFDIDFNGSAIENDIRVLRLAKVITDYLIEEGLELDDVLVYPEFSDGGRLEKLIQKLTELYSELYPQDLNAEDRDNLRMSISLLILHHLSENDEEDEFGKVFAITEYLSEILDSLFSALDENKDLSNTHSSPDKPDAETYITSFKKYEGEGAAGLWITVSPKPVSKSTPKRPTPINVDDIPLRPPPDLVMEDDLNQNQSLSPILEESVINLFNSYDSDSSVDSATDLCTVGSDLDDDRNPSYKSFDQFKKPKNPILKPKNLNIVVSNEVSFRRSKLTTVKFSQTSNLMFSTNVGDDKENSAGDWMGYESARF